MTKAADTKIERVLTALKKHDYMTEFSGMKFQSTGSEWRIQIDGARDEEMLVSETFGAKTPTSEIVEIVTNALAAAKREIAAREAAEREAARNRPATKEERRAFDNLMQRVEWAIKGYAKAAANMQQHIADGKAISSHVFDALMTAEAERKVMLWVNNCLMRDCSIVATLEDIVDLCDRETSFYRGHNSSSPASNVINEIEHVTFLKTGRIARLRTEY